LHYFLYIIKIIFIYSASNVIKYQIYMQVKSASLDEKIM